MSPFLQGFLKEASALKALAKPRNLLRAVGAGFVVVPTAMAAKAGYKRGRAGGQKARYLAASYDPISGRAMPSRAALTNYNPLFKKKLSEKKLKRMSKHYKEETFKR